jgi:glycerophosphoryl diester phosphodiesterase
VGADYVEADVRTTSDGKLMLMDDRTINRTTKGTGEVANLNFDQIRKLEVWDAGAAFEEALALAHRAGAHLHRFNSCLGGGSDPSL